MQPPQPRDPASERDERTGLTPEPVALEVGADIRLLDGAASLPQQIDSQRRIAADPQQPLEQRLEAYEDVIESEVGDTTLARARNLEREIGLRQVYVKFEGGNPSGTQKDRIAFAQVMDALRRGYDTVTAATCGNYGAALTLAASIAGLRCIVYVPRAYHARRIEEMRRDGAVIMREGEDYESAVTLSQGRAQKEELYDANPGGPNTPIQLHAYGEIAYEIYDELRDAPAAVAVPVSNGTTLAGVHKGFMSLYRRGKISRMPKLIAGSSFRKNPIVRAYLEKLSRCEDLEPNRVKESRVNEPLVNWHSIDGDHALHAIRDTGGWADYASDKSLVEYARLLREREGLDVMPASTAGLTALAQRQRKEPLPADRYVVLLTGRRA
jgi:threonine synthase